MHHHVKYWIKPDIENRIKNGEIEAYFNSSVQEIGIDHVVINTPHGPVRLKNDFVLALIGYHPDYDFLRSMGIELSEEQCRPVCDPVSLESNVRGIYVAGVIVAGSRTNEIFIENGRFRQAGAEDLKKHHGPVPNRTISLHNSKSQNQGQTKTSGGMARGCEQIANFEAELAAHGMQFRADRRPSKSVCQAQEQRRIPPLPAGFGWE
jgi:hypothetical protein